MDEQTIDMALSQFRDSGQETFKKRVALTGAKYVLLVTKNSENCKSFCYFRQSQGNRFCDYENVKQYQILRNDIENKHQSSIIQYFQ